MGTPVAGGGLSSNILAFKSFGDVGWERPEDMHTRTVSVAYKVFERCGENSDKGPNVLKEKEARRCTIRISAI